MNISPILINNLAILKCWNIPLTPFAESDVRAEKRPHEWLGGVLRMLGLALSARTSQIQQKVLKGYSYYLSEISKKCI
jgi:hypothetical protein